MSANYLTLCDFEEHDYQLIGVCTTLQDYKLAYLLNKDLGLKLNRIKPDLDYVVEGKEAFFSSFKYEDPKNLIDWYLINNKFKPEIPKGNALGLFHTEQSFVSSFVYLQPEIKEADFIIKIQGGFLESKLKNIIQEINKINGVVTAYSVDIHKLNHKEYLIF